MEEKPEAPTAPTGLQAEADGDGVQLEWESPSSGNDLQYNVYRSTDSIGSVTELSPINSDPVENSSFTDQTAERWTPYRYRVTAVRSTGDQSTEGAPSNQIRYTLPRTEYILEAPNPNGPLGFGVPLNNAGDIDGNGTGDLAVSNFNPNSSPQRVYLVGGASGAVIRELRPADLSSGDPFGGAGVGVGDIDGDGVPDVFVGTPEASGGAGQAHLLSGADGSVIWTRESPNPESGGEFGPGVSPGDLNNDGTPDLLVSAAGETVDGREEAGRAYLLDGADGAVLRTLTSPDPQEGEQFPGAASSIPDINGDGTEDLAFEVRLRDISAAEDAGQIYLISGADLSDGTDQALIRTLQSPNPQSGAQFGLQTDAVPDADGDGIPDILVGAPFETVSGKADAGRAYLMSSADGSVIRAFKSPQVEEGGLFGTMVEGTESIAADGFPDVAVRGVEKVGGADQAGRIYLFDGSSLVNGASPQESVVRRYVSPDAEVGGVIGTDFGILQSAGLLVAGANGESSGGVEDAGKVYAFPLP